MIRGIFLKELLNKIGQSGPIVSLYLNVAPNRAFKTELHSLIRVKKQWLGETRIDDPVRKVILELLEKIRIYVESLQRPVGYKLLVIFAGPDNFWQEYRLPVGLPSRLYIGPDPHIRPLTLILDEFPRYCVLVTNTRSARLFTLHLSEIEEHIGIFESDTPSWVSTDVGKGAKGPSIAGAAAWVGWREPKIQRHIKDHIQRHLKNICDKVFQNFKLLDFDRLIIGVPEGKEGRLYSMLEPHLHTYLLERLAGVFKGEPNMELYELKHRALEIAQEAERKEELAIIKRLLEKAGLPQKMGVVGLPDTISALMEAQVHTLIVDFEYQISGWICENDHFLSINESVCPLCRSKLVYVEDFIDEIVEEAIAQDAQLEHVFVKHPEFEKYRIGAILRFPYLIENQKTKESI